MPKKQKQSILSADLAIGRVTLVQKAVFAKHLAVMLASGMLINEALHVSGSAAKGKMRSVILGLAGSVESGNSLSDAMRTYPKIFSGLFIDVVGAGEASGNLPENLENIASQLEKEKNLISKVKSAMTYPAVILVAAFIMALAMSYYVLPQVTPLFTGLGVELPLTTRLVIWFSTLVQEHGGKLFIGIVSVITITIVFVKQQFSHPITHWILLKTPIVRSIVRNSNLARFSLTFGVLLRSGLTIDEALNITSRTVPNYYYRKAIRTTWKSIQKGATVADTLARHEKLFPKLLTSMVHVGESSGKLDESLVYLASFYELEVDSSTKTLTTAIEPILLLGIGVVVGTLALSIITPIYEITGNVSR